MYWEPKDLPEKSNPGVQAASRSLCSRTTLPAMAGFRFGARHLFHVPKSASNRPPTELASIRYASAQTVSRISWWHAGQP